MSKRKDPLVTLSPTKDWCPRHLEPFRKRWPRGYGPATMAVFAAFTALPEVTRYCGADDAHKGDSHRLPAALREFGPMCCAIDRAELRRITRRALGGYMLNPRTMRWERPRAR